MAPICRWFGLLALSLRYGRCMRVIHLTNMMRVGCRPCLGGVSWKSRDCLQRHAELERPTADGRTRDACNDLHVPSRCALSSSRLAHTFPLLMLVFVIGGPSEIR